MKRFALLLIVMLLMSSAAAFAQEATATLTPPPTVTPTPTLAKYPTMPGQGQCEPSRLCAWKYLLVDATFNDDDPCFADVNIPGIQPGDFVFFYYPKFASFDSGNGVAVLGWRITTNNTVRIINTDLNACDATWTLETLWWDRTYPERQKNIGDPPPVGP